VYISQVFIFSYNSVSCLFALCSCRSLHFVAISFNLDVSAFGLAEYDKVVGTRSPI
jgi:hypothetical protein